MNMKEIRKIIKETISVLLEGTSDYWPGYSDDTTADTLGELKKKTSKIQNQELKKLEKELLNMSVGHHSYLWKTEEERDFWQKNLWVNLVLTSLQDGFYIDRTLLEKSQQYLKDILDDSNLEKNVKESALYFKKSLLLTLQELTDLLESDGDTIYDPGFLNNSSEARISIDKKYGK